MHHSASKILGQLEAGTGRLTLTLDKGDTAWSPATAPGRPLHGPLKAEYVLHPDGGVTCTPADESRDLVCFASVFRGNAPNITHATLDGVKTLCGRSGWETSEGWADFGPDCLRCRRSLERLRAVER